MPAAESKGHRSHTTEDDALGSLNHPDRHQTTLCRLTRSDADFDHVVAWSQRSKIEISCKCRLGAGRFGEVHGHRERLSRTAEQASLTLIQRLQDGPLDVRALRTAEL